MAVKKKTREKIKEPPVVVEEERAEETRVPVVVEETNETDESNLPNESNLKEPLDKQPVGVVQEQPEAMEDQKQEDLRRPEDAGIWSNETNETNLTNKKSKAPMIIGLVVVLALLGAGGTYWYLQNRQVAVEGESGETSAEPIATPTPEVVLNRDEWKIEVLNGTATAGLAASVKAELEDLGYTVVKAGNADNKEYTETQVLVTSEMKDKVLAVFRDLEGNWGIEQTKEDGSFESTTANLRVIVGSEAVEDFSEEEEATDGAEE